MSPEQYKAEARRRIARARNIRLGDYTYLWAPKKWRGIAAYHLHVAGCMRRAASKVAT